jgi:CheY-like chemotaxis protein
MTRTAVASAPTRLPENGSDARTTILLAACLSHRLNNVLSGMVGTLDLDEDDAPLAGAETLAALVRQSTREAESLARSLAAILQDQRSGPERVALERCLPEVFHLLEMGAGNGCRYEIRMGAGPLEVEVERDMLARLCLLLGQAAMAQVEDGEAVQVRVERVDRRDGSVARLTIGPIQLYGGDEKIDLAAPFLQEAVTAARCLSTRPEGHREGTVSFELNLAKPTKRVAAAQKTSDIAGVRVLFVDDEKVVRQVVSSALRRLHAEGTVVDSPAEALRLVAEDASRYDIAITDFIMPEMTGGELFHQIKRLAPELPVLITSGYAEDKTIRACLEAGASGFLPKPFSLPVLAATIRQVLAPGGR